MTAARESQALAVSLGVHLLLLAVLLLLRQPAAEPRAAALRLTLAHPGGARPAAVPAAVPATTAAGAVPGGEQAEAARPNPVTGAAAPRARTVQTPVAGGAAAHRGSPPRPAAALAGALAALSQRAGVPPTPVPNRVSAPAPLPPHVSSTGLPAPRHEIELPYPAELITRGVEAEVEVRLTVADDGRVTGAEVLRSSGFSTVDAEAQQALRRILFAAGRAVTGTIRISYRLERGF